MTVTVTRGERVLRVDDGGTGGVPVLFLHSLGGSGAFWADELAHLRPTRRAVAFDQCGHGASTFAGGAALGEYAADALAVADALGLGRFVLVGHSFGASVALEVARRAPGRLAGLVLVDAAGSFREIPRDAIAQFLETMDSPAYAEVVRETWTVTLVRATEDTRARVLDTLMRADRRAVVGAYTALLDYEPGPALAAYRGPLLLVTDAANESAFSLHVQRPALPSQAIADASHWVMLDQPARFERILDDFLAALPAAPEPA